MARARSHAVHDTMKRLYQAAEQHSLVRSPVGSSAIANALGITIQMVNNWEKRGMSADGMLTAQRVFGINASWLESGHGADRIGTAGPASTTGPLLLGEPRAKPYAPNAVDIVHALGQLMVQAPLPTRRGVVAVLSGLEDHPEQGAQLGRQIDALLSASKRLSA